MSKLYELSYRTNINTYTFRDKHIILYDDHRTLLNILFEAKKLGEFTETPILFILIFTMMLVNYSPRVNY